MYMDDILGGYEKGHTLGNQFNVLYMGTCSPGNQSLNYNDLM